MGTGVAVGRHVHLWAVVASSKRHERRTDLSMVSDVDVCEKDRESKLGSQQAERPSK